MSKRFAVSTILVCLALNIGFGYFIYTSFMSEANGIITSASEAASSVGSQSLLKANLSKDKMPSADVAGVDPAEITRYKGAIRSTYNNDNNMIKVEYKVLAAPNIILSYYRTQLANKDWILQSTTKEKIVFIKADKTATVDASVDQSGITTYTISLK